MISLFRFVDNITTITQNDEVLHRNLILMDQKLNKYGANMNKMNTKVWSLGNGHKK